VECKEFGLAIFCQIPCNHICDLSKKKVTYFSNKNVITLMRAKKGEKVDWA
jgi:hypothetical protein